MKHRRSHQLLVGLFPALVPASGVQAQIRRSWLHRSALNRIWTALPGRPAPAIFPDGKTFPDLISFSEWFAIFGDSTLS